MRGPSTNNFNFQVKEAEQFKKALAALADSNVNRGDWALINVNPDEGFKVSVSDAATGDFSYVCLEPSLLTNFQCTKPLKNKKVPLKFTLRLLNGIADDLINIYSDSRILSFEYGTTPGISLSVSLADNNGEVEAYSGNTAHICKAILPTQGGFSNLIPEMIQNGISQSVSMDITSADVKISLAEKVWEFKSSVESGENMSLASGQSYHVEFKWSRLDSLMKAATLSEQLSLSLLPSNQIMLKFGFQGGTLVYIKQPETVVHKAQ